MSVLKFLESVDSENVQTEMMEHSMSVTVKMEQLQLVLVLMELSHVLVRWVQTMQ